MSGRNSFGKLRETIESDPVRRRRAQETRRGVRRPTHARRSTSFPGTYPDRASTDPGCLPAQHLQDRTRRGSPPLHSRRLHSGSWREARSQGELRRPSRARRNDRRHRRARHITATCRRKADRCRRSEASADRQNPFWASASGYNRPGKAEAGSRGRDAETNRRQADGSRPRKGI